MRWLYYKVINVVNLILIPFIFADYIRYIKTTHKKRFRFSIWNSQPKLFDNSTRTPFDRHYVLHTAWAARILSMTRPSHHVDISSSLYFNAITSAFIPIDFYDYRPVDINLDNLRVGAADLNNLHFIDDSIPSISCMHTIEHIGLGRYGDKIDPDGDIKAMSEILRVTSKDGDMLIVVPIGERPSIRFNAHRIYTYDQIICYFKGATLKEFALIPEHNKSASDVSNGDLVRNAPICLLKGEKYACGCFWFKKQ